MFAKSRYRSTFLGSSRIARRSVDTACGVSPAFWNAAEARPSVSASTPASASSGPSVASESCGLSAISWTAARSLHPPRIRGFERDRASQDVDRGIQLAQPHEAGGLGLEGIELRLDHRAGLGEMRHGALTVAFAVVQHREHRMRRRVVGALAQDPLEQRHGAPAAGLVVRLAGALERREIVRIDGQGALEGPERLGAPAQARERQAVEGPERGRRSASSPAPRGSARPPARSPRRAAPP